MALDRPFLPGYETWGCFEYAASGEGLARVARDVMEDGYEGALRGTQDARLVFEALDSGDPLARRVVDNAIQLWGMAVANLVSIFNPENIIFGGGVFGPAVKLLDRIRSEAERWAQPISMREVVLEPSRLGADAGLFGAARLAQQGSTGFYRREDGRL
jgi:glucokinase